MFDIKQKINIEIGDNIRINDVYSHQKTFAEHVEQTVKI